MAVGPKGVTSRRPLHSSIMVELIDYLLFSIDYLKKQIAVENAESAEVTEKEKLKQASMTGIVHCSLWFG